MEKTRVPKGEMYYFITSDLVVTTNIDNRTNWNHNHFKIGNYFTTKESAESMANKLRVVLNGAEVIETPDTDFVENKIHKIANEITQGYDRVYVADGEGNIHGNTTYEELTDYLRSIADLFKTKIVK